jgi:hypothetical protein
MDVKRYHLSVSWCAEAHRTRKGDAAQPQSLDRRLAVRASYRDTVGDSFWKRVYGLLLSVMNRFRFTSVGGSGANAVTYLCRMRLYGSRLTNARLPHFLTQVHQWWHRKLQAIPAQ